METLNSYLYGVIKRHFLVAARKIAFSPVKIPPSTRMIAVEPGATKYIPPLVQDPR